MGVRGLLGHCLSMRDECVDYIDLVQLAKQQNRVEILVDFYAFLHFLKARLWRGLSRATGNSYLRFIGAEYVVIDEYVTKLVTDLQAVGLHLVFFVDGAKGSSRDGTKQKLSTWKRRHANDVHKMGQIVSVCARALSSLTLNDSSFVRPVLLEVQVLQTLSRCKCEVVQCVSGEADPIMATELRKRAPIAAAVFSNDSDFLIFAACKLVPHDLFDLDDDLRLDNDKVLPMRPTKLIVGVISSEKVIQLMKLRDHSQLVDLSIICGNDFTGPLLQHLSPTLSLPGNGDIRCIINWIRENRLEDHPGFTNEMRINDNFRAAVQTSHSFYSNDAVAPPSSGSSLYEVLALGVREVRYPVHVMGMHAGFYWHRTVLEAFGPGLPCAEEALCHLRKYIYRMVLPHSSDSFVMEWGRTPQAELKSFRVYPVRDKMVRTLDYMHPQSVSVHNRLRTFTDIMLHQEPHFPCRYIERYGRHQGFKYHILRYFLVLNTVHGNLRITQNEFIALFAAVICSTIDEDWYRQRALLPTVRCVTIASWVQCLYRYAYGFLAKLLHICEEFPEPKQFFCSSIWTAFFMTSAQQGSDIRLSASDCRRIHGDMQRVLRDQRHIVPHVTDGIFLYDDRF